MQSYCFELQIDDWIALKPTVISSEDGRIFTLVQTFSDLKPGVYVAQLKAKNSYGWSEYSAVSPFPKGMKIEPLYQLK